MGLLCTRAPQIEGFFANKPSHFREPPPCRLCMTKFIGLFCKRALQIEVAFAKELNYCRESPDDKMHGILLQKSPTNRVRFCKRALEIQGASSMLPLHKGKWMPPSYLRIIATKKDTGEWVHAKESSLSLSLSLSLSHSPFLSLSLSMTYLHVHSHSN